MHLTAFVYKHCTIKMWTSVSVQQGHNAVHMPAVSSNARTVQFSHNILIIKANEMHYFSSLFLVKNSTYFGQIYCPSS